MSAPRRKRRRRAGIRRDPIGPIRDARTHGNFALNFPTSFFRSFRRDMRCICVASIFMQRQGHRGHRDHMRAQSQFLVAWAGKPTAKRNSSVVSVFSVRSVSLTCAFVGLRADARLRRGFGCSLLACPRSLRRLPGQAPRGEHERNVERLLRRKKLAQPVKLGRILLPHMVGEM